LKSKYFSKILEIYYASLFSLRLISLSKSYEKHEKSGSIIKTIIDLLLNNGRMYVKVVEFCLNGVLSIRSFDKDDILKDKVF